MRLSGVPERLRNLSQYEFYNTANEIWLEAKGIASSSAIPKSQRFTVSVPMVQTARGIVQDIVTAEAFYPSTQANVEMRKMYLTFAVAGCEQLYQDAQNQLEFTRRRGDFGHVGRFERLAELVDAEIRLLKGARKGVKLVGKR